MKSLAFFEDMRLFLLKVSLDGLFDRASALAFQIVFSLIPTIAIAYAVFASVGGLDALRVRMNDWLLQYLAPAMAEQVSGYLGSVEDRVSPEAVGTFGLLFFALTAFNMIGRVESSLNAIWGVTIARPLKRKIPLYLAGLVLVPVALGGSLALTSYLASMVTRQASLFFGTADVLNRFLVFAMALAPMLITSSFLTLIYKILPLADVRTNAAVRAGFATGFVLEVLKNAYAFYASYALGNSVYGALAALPILFLWISLTATVFLLGGELCYFFDQRSTGIKHVQPPEAKLSLRMLIDILREIDFARDEARFAAAADGRRNSSLTAKDLTIRLNWDASVVHQHIDYLVRHKFIASRARSVFARPRQNDVRYVPLFAVLDEAVKKLAEQFNRIQYEQWRIENEALASLLRTPCAR